MDAKSAKNAFSKENLESEWETDSDDGEDSQNLTTQEIMNQQLETLEQEQYSEVMEWRKTGVSKAVTINRNKLVNLYLACDENIPGIMPKAMKIIKADYLEGKRLTDKLERLKDSEYYLFITLNPANNVTWEEFFKYVNKVVNQKHMKGRCEWVFEQNGIDSNTMGQNFHCHILYKKNGCRSGRNKLTFKLTLSKLINAAKSSKIDFGEGYQGINIVSKYHSMYSKQIDYMKGLKEGEEKQKSIEINPIWRASIDIEPAYENHGKGFGKNS